MDEESEGSETLRVLLGSDWLCGLRFIFLGEVSMSIAERNESDGSGGLTSFSSRVMERQTAPAAFESSKTEILPACSDRSRNS